MMQLKFYMAVARKQIVILLQMLIILIKCLLLSHFKIYLADLCCGVTKNDWYF